MVEPVDANKAKRNVDKFSGDERYLGLSKHEVQLRARMAKKFGRDTKHLDQNTLQEQILRPSEVQKPPNVAMIPQANFFQPKIVPKNEENIPLKPGQKLLKL